MKNNKTIRVIINAHNKEQLNSSINDINQNTPDRHSVTFVGLAISSEFIPQLIKAFSNNTYLAKVNLGLNNTKENNLLMIKALENNIALTYISFGGMPTDNETTAAAENLVKRNKALNKAAGDLSVALTHPKNAAAITNALASGMPLEQITDNLKTIAASPKLSSNILKKYSVLNKAKQALLELSKAGLAPTTEFLDNLDRMDPNLKTINQNQHDELGALVVLGKKQLERTIDLVSYLPIARDPNIAQRAKALSPPEKLDSSQAKALVASLEIRKKFKGLTNDSTLNEHLNSPQSKQALEHALQAGMPSEQITNSLQKIATSPNACEFINLQPDKLVYLATLSKKQLEDTLTLLDDPYIMSDFKNGRGDITKMVEFYPPEKLDQKEAKEAVKSFTERAKATKTSNKNQQR